jgi:hypothetical protein
MSDVLALFVLGALVGAIVAFAGRVLQSPHGPRRVAGLVVAAAALAFVAWLALAVLGVARGPFGP